MKPLSTLPLLVLVGIAAHAEDFNQWRGPQRNGITTGGPTLDVRWDKSGPVRLWENTDLNGELGDGSGCVSIAGGKAYAYGQSHYTVDLVTRRLTDLERGRKSLPPDVMTRLETVKNREFADPAALQAWLVESGISNEWHAAIMRLAPAVQHKSWDTLLCIDDATGKTVFRKQLEGAGPYGSYPYGASSTPTIADGRCYFCGSKNDIYCLDAGTGEVVWHYPAPARARAINHSAPLVTNGMVIVAAGPLTALDAQKGTVLWTQPQVVTRENSPVVWKSGSRTFLLCNNAFATATVHCVDLQDGRVAWSVPAGGRNTPAILGDIMITSTVIGKFLGDPTKYGLIAYRLSPERAEKLWSTETYSGGDESAVVYDGHVYGFASGTAACLELLTGKVCWEAKTSHKGVRSGVVADGKIFTLDGSSLVVLRATPEKYDPLAKVKLPVCYYSSPVVCNGRLYLRQLKSVACYDLTRATAAAAP